VGGYQGDQRSTIQALIVKNPRRPRVVGIVEMTGDLWDVNIYGNLLYAADAMSGLRTYDVSAPKHPVLLHTVPGHSVAVDRCGTWVAQAISLDGVSVLDGTDPENPVEIASHEAPAGNYAHSVALEGSLVVSGYSGGLATYRIENAILSKSPEVAALIPPPLLKISPNPLRQGAASLTVKVPLNGTGRLRVYDIEGRVVRSWEVAGTPGETQEVRWDGTSGEGHGLAQGVYFVQFSAGEKRVTERMLIMR